MAHGTENHRPRAIGVIGGNRGAAFVHMLVTKGYPVVIREANDAALGNTLFHMLAVFQQEVTRGGMSQAELMRNLRNIHGTTAWKGFEDLDLVLDVGEDDPRSKKALFRELEEQTSTQALLITTAPTVSVAEVQEGRTHPERVAGLHFLAPASRSLLVEVVSSDKTQSDVSRRLKEFVTSLGRVPWPVKDTPGLLIERLLIPYLNEAILLVKEGLDPARVEEAMVRFGVMQGPLEYLDVMGWDVAAVQAQALAPILQARLVLDDTFAFMVAQGWLGQKTGAGFYRYRRKKKTVNHALIGRLRSTSHAEAPHTMEAMSRADQLAWARQRLVLLMVNEAAWCVAEGRAESPEAVDLALMLAGWAPHRGGPLRYARHVGWSTVLEELDELAVKHGSRYEPCPVLRGLAETNAD
jgi:3-hydroxyacyl-CoA dehydrogenase/enoyl-CoA hydratase/3-hydroxybutyryl-CoA epimerase